MSLQNGPVKIITKILTTRLLRHIQQLIDLDQTGFKRGCTISENFVCATELVQYCHRNRHPTMVLKLDFAKAFDSVSWDSMVTILCARGFPDKWLEWMQQLFTTSHSAFLVNRCPGRWINATRGCSVTLPVLACSRYSRAADQKRHRHSATSLDGPCQVLQYADDTLMLVRAEVTDIRQLKKTLDDFALATGLKINFTKSTLVPMHVPASHLQRIVRILQCQQPAFPQVILGPSTIQRQAQPCCFHPTHLQDGPQACWVAGGTPQSQGPAGLHQFGTGWTGQLYNASRSTTTWSDRSNRW